MDWITIALKFLPYGMIGCGVLFLIILSLHIKDLRYKNYQQEIKLSEKDIDEVYNNLSDNDVLTQLNKLEGPGSDTLKKG